MLVEPTESTELQKTNGFDTKLYIAKFLENSHERLHKNIISNIDIPNKNKKIQRDKGKPVDPLMQPIKKVRNVTKQNFHLKVARQGPLARSNDVNVSFDAHTNRTAQSSMFTLCNMINK